MRFRFLMEIFLLTRRFFLTTASAALTTLATPAIASTTPKISLKCLHTGASCAMHFDGGISQSDYDAFCAVTQDWRRSRTREMDVGLIRFLSGIVQGAESEATMSLISGYRTPATNRALTGTAKGSLHIQGRALDLRHPHLTTRELRDIALALQMGGVGYYPGRHNRFVHIDTGRFRHWQS